MELSTRALSVLREIVERYIRTGAAVASGQVARSSRITLSAATIRGVTARLEGGGLVTRAHASAGTVPTDLGIRVYVDSLLPSRRLPAAVRRRLRDRVTASGAELVESIEAVARLTADATRETGVAIRPMGDEPVLEAVSLVDLGGGLVMGVLVTADGAVAKRLLRLDEDVPRQELEGISNALGKRFRGWSVGAISNAFRQADDARDGEAGARSRDLHEAARRIGARLFAPGESAEVVVAAAHHLLESTAPDEIDDARRALVTLGDRTKLVREWRRGFACSRTHVAIGDESEVTAGGGLAMVATLFYRGGRRVGALGVVGPRHMDYGRIVPMVELIGDTITDVMEEGERVHA
jgi:heat-inducible transcriptional repressor